MVIISVSVTPNLPHTGSLMQRFCDLIFFTRDKLDTLQHTARHPGGTQSTTTIDKSSVRWVVHQIVWRHDAFHTRRIHDIQPDLTSLFPSVRVRDLCIQKPFIWIVPTYPGAYGQLLWYFKVSTRDIDPDSKVYGANMGPTGGRQEPCYLGMHNKWFVNQQYVIYVRVCVRVC